jgi:hypothetical protein
MTTNKAHLHQTAVSNLLSELDTLENLLINNEVML